MTLTLTTPGDLEILITRVFNAPRQLVYDANTRPELVQRWLGVRNNWVMATCELNAVIGGTYRFIWRHQTTNKEIGTRGTYLEVVAPIRTLCTEIFDNFVDESLVTSTYDENDGKTTVTLLMSYPTKEIRDMVLSTGMARGIDESYDVLDQVLLAVA